MITYEVLQLLKTMAENVAITEPHAHVNVAGNALCMLQQKTE